MRRIQKILGGIFLTGVIVGGVGTGIAMVEYSSLAYGGEKVIGEDSLVTSTLDFNFELDGRTLEVANVRYWGKGERQEIQIDNTVPAGTVRFEVTYNEKTVTPDLEFEAYEEEDDESESGDEADQSPGEEKTEEAETEYQAEDEAADREEGMSEAEVEEPIEDLTDEENRTGRELQEEEEEETKPGKLGCLRLISTYHGNDFAILMENKDRVLEELKQGMISSYDVAYITNIKIKVNQETVPYIDSYYAIR